jgi:hypothetical protein
MRYLVAAIGALVIFVCAFIVIGVVLSIAAPSLLSHRLHLGPLVTSNPVGLVLATLAATSSFRASLRRCKKKHARPSTDGQNQNGDALDSCGRPFQTNGGREQPAGSTALKDGPLAPGESDR